MSINSIISNDILTKSNYTIKQELGSNFSFMVLKDDEDIFNPSSTTTTVSPIKVARVNIDETYNYFGNLSFSHTPSYETSNGCVASSLVAQKENSSVSYYSALTAGVDNYNLPYFYLSGGKKGLLDNVFNGSYNEEDGDVVFSIGDAYKVTKDGTYAGKSCDAGDILVCTINSTTFNNRWAKYTSSSIKSAESASSFNSSTTYSQYDVYKVTTAGTYAGIVCEVNDYLLCVQKSTAFNNEDWKKITFKSFDSTNTKIFNSLSSYNVGDIYEVEEKGTYAGIECEPGEVLVCVKTDGSTFNDNWVSVNGGGGNFISGTYNIDGSSTGAFTTLANYTAGQMYNVTAAGTYAGKSCVVGDILLCVTSYSSAFNNSDWVKLSKLNKIILHSNRYFSIDTEDGKKVSTLYGKVQIKTTDDATNNYKINFDETASETVFNLDNVEVKGDGTNISINNTYTGTSTNNISIATNSGSSLKLYGGSSGAFELKDGASRVFTTDSNGNLTWNGSRLFDGTSGVGNNINFETHDYSSITDGNDATTLSTPNSGASWAYVGGVKNTTTATSYEVIVGTANANTTIGSYFSYKVLFIKIS